MKQGKKWYRIMERVPILARDFEEILSEEITYEQRPVMDETFQAKRTKSVKAMI